MHYYMEHAEHRWAEYDRKAADRLDAEDRRETVHLNRELKAMPWYKRFVSGDAVSLRHDIKRRKHDIATRAIYWTNRYPDDDE